MTRSRLIHALLLGLLAAQLHACADDPAAPEDAAAPTADAAGADADASTPDTAAADTTPPKPAGFKATLTADVTDGNAPLAVTFGGSFTGIPEEEAEILWDFGNGSFSQKLSPGEFVYHSEGTYLVKLTVTQAGTPWTASDEVVVTVRGAADLRVSKPQVDSATELPPGGTLVLSYVVNNDGDRIDAAFDLVTVLSKDEKLDLEDDLVVETLRLEGMGRSGTAEGVLSRQQLEIALPGDLKTGSYFLLVKVDAHDEVNEINELNNTALSTSFVTIAVGADERPDLTVTGLTYQPGPYAAGQFVNFSLTLENQGTVPADAFKFRVYLSDDQALDEGDVAISEDSNSTIFSIAAGQKIVVQRSWPVPPTVAEGVYWLIAKVDATEAVIEGDEGNNVLAGASPFGVETVEVKGFDLDITKAAVTPHSTYWNGSLKVDLDVTNNGNLDAPKWTVAIYASKTVALNPNYATLVSKVPLHSSKAIPAGQTVSYSEVVKLPGTIGLGTYYIGAIVDPDDKLAELEEGNNWAVIPEPVELYDQASADLKIAQLTASPLVVNAGEHLKLGYLLDSTGSTTTGAFTNLVVLSKDAVININEVKGKKDVPIAAIPIGEVLPNEPQARTDKVIVPLELDHTVTTWWVGVIADANGDVVIDPDKSNNVVVAPQPLTVVGAAGGCFEDDLEPNDNQTQAKPLGNGLHGPQGSCGNDDWYTLDVPKGHSLFVSVDAEEVLSVDPVDPELDVVLVDAAGKTVDQSTAKGSHDEVRAYTLPESQTLALRVRSATFGGQAHYGVGVKVVPPVDGVDLVVDDVEALPPLVYPGGALELKWRLVNLGDEASGPLTVGAWLVDQPDRPPAEGIALGSVVVGDVAAASSKQGGMQVFVPSVEAGAFWVAIVADAEQDVVEVAEDNNTAPSGVIVVDTSLSCEGDPYEPNDAPGIASPLPAAPDLLAGLTVCPKLDDWYAFELPAKKAFAVTVKYAYDGAKGELGVELYDPTGGLVASQLGGKGTATVYLPYVFNPGSYKVRVYNVSVSGAPYAYSLGVLVGTPSTGDACAPDVFEPNGASTSSAAIGCGLHELTMCKTDTDWLLLPAVKGEELTLTLNHPKAELRADLFEDPGGKAVASLNGNGVLAWTPAATGSLALRVAPKAKDGIVTVHEYTLFVDGIPGVDLRVGELSAYPAELVQGEDAVVSMRLENQCKSMASALEWSLFVSGDDQWDPLDLEVLGGVEPGGLVGKGVVELVEKATVPASTPAGPAWLIAVADPADVVDESIETNNARSLPIEVAAICVEDALEPNGTPPQAPKIQANQPYGGLALCPSDLDWYKVDLQAGKVVTVSIQFVDEVGDLDLRLYGPGDTTKPVASSITPGQDGESLEYVVKTTGTHFIRVNGFNGAANTYSLVVTAP